MGVFVSVTNFTFKFFTCVEHSTHVNNLNVKLVTLTNTPMFT